MQLGSRCLLVAVLTIAGCGKKSDSKADKVAPPAPAAIDARASPPPPPAVDASTAPALPALGDPPQGMDVAKAKACDAGDAAACVAAAESLAPHGGYRAELSKEEADRREAGTAKYAERACELKNGQGCYLWAMYGKYPKGNELLARACDLGSPEGCSKVGQTLLADGHSDADVMRGRALLEKACRDKVQIEYDDPGSNCSQIADEWAKNRGALKKDKAKAAELRKLACDQGYREGCPCKKDEDCAGGSDPDADFYCFENKCTQASPD